MDEVVHSSWDRQRNEVEKEFGEDRRVDGGHKMELMWKNWKKDNTEYETAKNRESGLWLKITENVEDEMKKKIII